MEADLFSLKKTSSTPPAPTKLPAAGGLKKDSTSIKSPENPEGLGNSVQTFPIYFSFVVLPAVNQMSSFYM